MRKYAIILAGGEGRRFGGTLPKQFLPLCGKPMLWWSMRAFHKADPDTYLIAVVHPGFFEDMRLEMLDLPEDERYEYTLCCGGRSRAESVKNGLISVAQLVGSEEDPVAHFPDDVYVAVHDAARPVIGCNIIDRGWSAAMKYSAAVPCVGETNSLRMYDDARHHRLATHCVERADYLVVQTPQMFSAELLRLAYAGYVYPSGGMEDPYAGCTDDASFVEHAGNRVAVYDGDTRNMKVTHPEDIELASILLGRLLKEEHESGI